MSDAIVGEQRGATGSGRTLVDCEGCRHGRRRCSGNGRVQPGLLGSVSTGLVHHGIARSPSSTTIRPRAGMRCAGRNDGSPASLSGRDRLWEARGEVAWWRTRGATSPPCRIPGLEVDRLESEARPRLRAAGRFRGAVSRRQLHRVVVRDRPGSSLTAKTHSQVVGTRRGGSPVCSRLGQPRSSIPEITCDRRAPGLDGYPRGVADRMPGLSRADTSVSNKCSIHCCDGLA